MTSIVKELISQNGTRKVEIFRREDGSFGFEELRFSDDPLEKSWFPYGRYSVCFAMDEETAESETRSRVDWLRTAGDDV